MEKTKCVVFLIMMINFVVGEDELACCPPSTYIKAEEQNECWDPFTNNATTIRLDCNRTTNIFDFTVNDGYVMIETPIQKLYVNSTLACIGNTTIMNENGSVVEIALLCKDDDILDQLYIRDYYFIEDVVLGYCMTASVFFLILTVVIYSSLSELRDLFGKSIINFCSSLALGMFLMSILKFVSYRGERLCAFRGYSAYFFLLAAFFWANSISIQVMIETRFPSSTDYSWRRYRWYMLYSWGVPALLTLCVAAINHLPGDHERPGIGHKICWFSNLQQQWYYMYSVMTILILINIVIFVMTLTMVWRQTFLSNHLRTLKIKISITIRLFVVMGLPWIFEMICASVETHIVWSIISIFNSSQGILMFLILVVFRKKVIRLLHKRGWLCCCASLVERCLSVGDHTEDNVLQHTDVPLSDTHPMT